MPTSLRDTVEPFLVPVHREGRPFILIAAVLTVLLFLFAGGFLGLLGLLATGFVAFFFRDPPRVVPLAKGLVVAPGDGRVVEVGEAQPPAEFGIGDEHRTRVAIFLSVFDVHVQRSPVAGRIDRYVYTPGGYANAASPEAASENERKAMVLAMADGAEIAVVQIAGLVARRIVTFLGEGDSVGVGERYGLIRFGSRVELWLPPDVPALVAVGQYVRGGETVVADLTGATAPRETIVI
jgi:phosphatidylserine decarboxylase